MINLPNFSNRNRSIYPGVFTPNPFISEALDEKSSFNVRSEIFSNIHISEDEEYFLIEIDTPGLRREDFLIRINERGNLLVSGIKKILDFLLKNLINLPIAIPVSQEKFYFPKM